MHRIRGHGKPLRLELNYLVWIGFIFGWLVQFWWFEFKWTTPVTDVDFRLCSFLVLDAVAVILVPHRLEAVDDSWEYFHSIRPWFFGGLLARGVIGLLTTRRRVPPADTPPPSPHGDTVALGRAARHA